MDELDHRNLGISLDLYHIQEDAPGMIFWHPRGYAIYRVLEDYIRGHMRRLGYQEVRTPQLLPRELWVRSGHWEKFGDNMYALGDADGREMAMKPMSCPGHIQIFNRKRRSWRELPLRYSEFGSCHRNESSGSMHGLMRSRAFEQDDAHVICREQDMHSEVARFIALQSRIYAELGFAEYSIALSTRPEKRAGSDEVWDWAEEQLGDAARQCGIEYSLLPGEGAFYGPKLEFHLKDRQGRFWQCGTIQLDLVLPGRLGASYIAPDGSEAVPIMLHHVVFGSMGRLIAMLVERLGGALPFWLSPDQVVVAPISEQQEAYARDVVDALSEAGIRAVLYDGGETLSRRIVSAHAMGIPVMAVVGQREADAGSVTLRERDGSQRSMLLAETVQALSRRRE